MDPYNNHYTDRPERDPFIPGSYQPGPGYQSDFNGDPMDTEPQKPKKTRKKKGWIKSDKKPALNPDLWDSLLTLTEQHDVRCHWVKGHAANPKNNRCDEMAVSEWKRLKG